MLTRWMRQPQRMWLRRACFQVHLWTGLAIGLYVVVLSLSGSVLVYRAELDRHLASPRAVLNEQLTPMTADDIGAAAARLYPDWTVTAVYEGLYRPRPARRGRPNRPPDPTASVILERNGETRERLFDPYTGADLGDSVTQGQLAILWLVKLHDELLLERTDGRRVNGTLSLVFTLIVLTGFVIWWPGVARWTRSLRISAGSGWRRFNWDLHSAVGFWFFLFMLMWGVSGWYLGIPEPLTEWVHRFSPPPGEDGVHRGELGLSWLARLHFGRWREPGWGPWLQAVWAAVGLVPVTMFVTGTIMWWNRVVRRRHAAPTI